MSKHIDNVNSPPHYKRFKGVDEAYQIIDIVVTQAGLSPAETFKLGNCLKYILRLGAKGDSSKVKEDLGKAKWYLDKILDGLN
jgi:hypothetical protein